MHKYQYTLDLLKQVIDKAPKFFPEERRAKMLASFGEMKNDPSVPREKIEDAVIAFGKEIWPYRKAFWHVHDEARLEEEQYIREKLSSSLKGKYEQFLSRGGRIEDIKKEAQLEDLETFFTSDEMAEIVAAKLSAHDRVVAEVNSLCGGEKKDVCTGALEKYQKEMEEISELIGQLKKLAEQSEQWQGEILDKVRVFEEGWSGIEREVEKSDVKGEIDYYLGVISLTMP